MHGLYRGGGISRQVKFAVVNFTEGNFAEPPGFCVVPPARVHNVYCLCKKFAENPEFRVGNFAVNLKRENFPRKIKVPRNPPPPPPRTFA